MSTVAKDHISHHALPSPEKVIALSIWLLMATYLYADTLTGFSLWRFGASIPLSQFWKGLLLALILLWSGIVSATFFFWIVLISLALISGPIIRLLDAGTTDAFVETLVMAFKVLMPFVILSFGNWAQLNHRELASKWSERVLWLSLVAMLLNLAAGLAGLGFTSYGTSERGGLGIVGFFPSGNEVSSLFTILSGFVLMKTWLWKRSLYLFVSLLCAVTGLLIATKTAIGSALLFSILIPVAYKRGNWHRVSIRSTIVLLFIVLAISLALMKIWDVLQTFGLADRLSHIYETRGLIGIILSGRDAYAETSGSLLWSHSGIADLFFGLGPEKLEHFGAKLTTEMDPFDLYLWFGIPGIVYGLTTYFAYLYIASRGYLTRKIELGPGVLVINAGIVATSVLSGHVIMGGMAGICWAALNTLVLLEAANTTKATNSLLIGVTRG